VELSIRNFATRASLIPKYQRRLVVSVAQKIFGEVQSRVGEEARPWHLIGMLERGARTPVGAHVGEVCELLPKVAWLRD
jgi:hypothetical protein